jgi:hypothetical protein
MEECTICYYKYLEEDFFSLKCCFNKICHSCLECIQVPLCPYCRNVIKEIKDDSKYRLSISLTDNFIIPNISTGSFDSRITRRQVRRQIRLINREVDRRRNKELSRSRRMSNIQNIIDEDIFLFER